MVTGGSAAVAASLLTLGRSKQAVARGYGDLVPDPNGILDLPAGFSYAILEEAGDDMSDGYRVPGRPDGMACFAGPDNTLIVMRNHENSDNDFLNGPYKLGQTAPAQSYDASATGGVTRLVVDADSFARISSNLVLVGTVRNCAGGPSPWGWLSCEENVSITGGIRHGYTFVCPIDAETVQAPQRIDGYGRYNHEAVAIDPSNHYAYLTEDRGDSCLYRFVPDSFDTPFEGKLQALKIVGVNQYDTDDMTENDVLEVEWVDIDNPDPNNDSVRDEAQGKGAAIFVRGEGIWFFEGQVYICSTSGGPVGAGQIFRLIDGDNATLELVVRSTDTSVLDKPDNITVAPWGEVFMAEDGDGDQYIRWITAEGEVCDFARNDLSEFAGVCFSPDGRAMFVNIQGAGLTLVITGPFPMLGGGDGDGDPGDGDGDPGDGDGDPSTGDGDGDPDPSTTGDGDGDPATGDGDGDPDPSTTGDGDSTTGGDSGEDGGGDELGGGETGDTGETGGDPALDGDDGCNCSTDAEPSKPGLTAAVTAAAVVGLKALLRGTDEGESAAD